MKVVICSDRKDVVDIVDDLYTGFKVENNKITMDNVIKNDKFESLKKALKKKNISFAIKEADICKTFKSEIYDKNKRRYDVFVNYEGQVINYCVRDEDTNALVGGALCDTYAHMINAYAIKEEYRGLGLGDSLIGKILRDNPVTMTRACIDSRNLPSLRILSKYGFVVYGMIQDRHEINVSMLHLIRETETDVYEAYIQSSGSNLTWELLEDMDYR